MRLSLGLQAGERLTPSQTIELARYSDEVGVDSIWVAEGRLTRDAIAPAALIAGVTTRIRIGTGVINHKTRNVGLTAVTFKTLDEFAPGRVILGIGPWWEPLASKLGLPLVRPTAELREYITVLRRLFDNEAVTFKGEFVCVDGIRFDRTYAENEPVNMPIYLGVVGPRNLRLAGEIADGVLLDFLLPPSYTEQACGHLAAGMALRPGQGSNEFHRPQLVACAVSDIDPDEAIDACRAFLTMYLGQQSHIGEHSGIDADLLARIRAELGWPTTLDQVKRVMRLVPDDLVHAVSACGTTGQALEKIESYLEAGATTAVLCLLGDHKSETLRAVVAGAR
jgi:5,10-methylenetetrahydromethanopterin reductase